MSEPGRDDDREPKSLDAWLGSFASDATLRPVLIVVIGSLSAIGAGVLLLARGGSLAAMAALGLMALGTLDVLQRDLRQRRLGAAARLALLLWLFSGVAAVVAVATGLA